MNILFLIGVYPGFGGTEKITTVLANSFSKDGNNVHIVSFKQANLEVLDELDPTIQLHTLSYPVYSKDNIKLLRKIVIDNHIEFIINQWCLPFFTTLLCKKSSKGLDFCKIISVLHGVPDNSKKVIIAKDKIKKASNFISKNIARTRLNIYNLIIKYSIRYVYKNSDSYVLLSPSFIDSFKAYTSIKKTNKLYAIGNPITISINEDLEVYKQKKKQILYVGRLDNENKRVIRIIKAWEELYLKYPDWKLVLVGDGPDRKSLEEYVNTKQIKRVDFKGFVKEEPTSFYKDASILMLTSDLEGFGLVIVEGMNYGVIPIVYGSYSAVYDIITNQKDGFITHTPYSNKETINCLEKIINDESLRLKMSYNAMKKSQDFLLDSILDKWYKIFKNNI